MVDPFESVVQFENEVAQFFGANYGVATDSCTHALELCIRLENIDFLCIPTRTYLSVPMLASKLGIEWCWNYTPWKDYYYISKTIIDAAVVWRRNAYVPGTLMCLSFQYQKHLNLGRGGMILLNDAYKANVLRKMSYDGRERGVPWRDQNIYMLGYHYYMTPEVAAQGLKSLPSAIDRDAKRWEYTDWPDLTKMKVFQK